MRILLTLLLCGFMMGSVAQSLNGIYTFSKGMNKASATLYLAACNTDSVFLILQTVSGMPDFETGEWKGFVNLNQDKIFQSNTCSFRLLPKGNTVTLQTLSDCRWPFHNPVTFRKSSGELKPGNQYLSSFTERTGIIKLDSVPALQAPAITASQKLFLHRKEEVALIDEFENWYFAVLPTRKGNGFWIPKKSVQVLNNP
ncbi:MAG TPA: hypothetical protein PLP34_04575 [Chitinophagaceae bacterium]|nr:hypothetical protein [Chitinophagaceae bacterium]